MEMYLKKKQVSLQRRGSSSEDDKNSSEEISINKRNKYAQKYVHKWENEFPWLKKEGNSGYCILCKRSLDNNFTNMKRHANARKHKKREAEIKVKTNLIEEVTVDNNAVMNLGCIEQEADILDFSPSLKSPVPSTRSESTPLTTESFRKKKTNNSEGALQQESFFNNTTQILSSPHDSYQIFGDYVADQMRNMSKAKQKRLKLLIQKTIIQVEEEPEAMEEMPFVIVEANPTIVSDAAEHL